MYNVLNPIRLFYKCWLRCNLMMIAFMASKRFLQTNDFYVIYFDECRNLLMFSLSYNIHRWRLEVFRFSVWKNYCFERVDPLTVFQSSNIGVNIYLESQILCSRSIVSRCEFVCLPMCFHTFNRKHIKVIFMCLYDFHLPFFFVLFTIVHDWVNNLVHLFLILFYVQP